MSEKGRMLKGSEARLWRLIEERSRADSDKVAIDRRIFDLFGEQWCVMFTDLSGFSRHVDEFGIIHFLQVIHESHKLVLPIVEAHDGLLVKVEGDSLLLLFRRPERGIACAIAMQEACEKYSENRPPEEQVLLCLGIGFGVVLRIGDTDVWGREVNGASKLGEDTARAGEILVTRAAKEAADAVAAHSYEDIGHGFSENERIYRLMR
jgi:class 3 adenylate cyclase